MVSCDNGGIRAKPNPVHQGDNAHPNGMENESMCRLSYHQISAYTVVGGSCKGFSFYMAVQMFPVFKRHHVPTVTASRHANTVYRHTSIL